MKGLRLIFYEYYTYYALPDGFDSLAQLIDYANEHFYSYLLLTEYREQDCRFPYFIEEYTEKKYVKISSVQNWKEVEFEVLSKKEYDERLTKLVETKCVTCQNYEQETDPNGDNLKGHRTNITLDGECYGYEPIGKENKT